MIPEVLKSREVYVDRGARDAERQRLLGRDEWCRRYARRIHSQTGVRNDIAGQVAKTAWEEAEKERRQDPEIDQQEPEAAADEELTYWDE